jgi:hypothetical protein
MKGEFLHIYQKLSFVIYQAHNLKVVSSNLAPATGLYIEINQYFGV